MRRFMIIAVLLVGLTLGTSAASAQGVSPATLTNANWTCFPVFGATHCAPPGGLARVLSGEAETMTFLVFRISDGSFLGTELIVRGDIFNGQPCPTDPPSGQYTYLPDQGLPLNYYACHRYNSPF